MFVLLLSGKQKKWQSLHAWRIEVHLLLLTTSRSIPLSITNKFRYGIILYFSDLVPQEGIIWVRATVWVIKGQFVHCCWRLKISLFNLWGIICDWICKMGSLTSYANPVTYSVGLYHSWKVYCTTIFNSRSPNSPFISRSQAQFPYQILAKCFWVSEALRDPVGLFSAPIKDYCIVHSCHTQIYDFTWNFISIWPYMVLYSKLFIIRSQLYVFWDFFCVGCGYWFQYPELYTILLWSFSFCHYIITYPVNEMH